MENYLSLYRKYRPQTFEEVVGQNHIVQTLKNAILLNRVSHAYLFAGMKGTGKTTIARIFAKALNCKKGPTPEPCGHCEICQKISAGQAVDVFELDAASNRGIDQIRDLKEGINFVPVEARYKVYIIDEVHMLSDPAFNALLKTLEEPPEFTVFILATTNPEKIPATILSRVQRFDFRKISDLEIIKILEKIARSEKINLNQAVCRLIAEESSGSLRDAISLLDELIAYKTNNLSPEDVRFLLGSVSNEFLDQFFEAIIKKEYSQVFGLIDGALSEGKNFTQILEALANYFRQILFLKLKMDKEIVISEERRKFLQEQTEFLPVDFLKDSLKKISKTFQEIKIHPYPKLYLELAVMEIMESLPDEKQEFLRKEQIQRFSENFDEAQKVEEKEETIKTYNNTENFVGELTLMQVKQVWNDFLEKVKNKSRATHILISEANLSEVKNKKIILKFRRGYTFYREKLKEEESRKLLQDLLDEVFGPGVRLELEIEETKDTKILSDNSSVRKPPVSASFEDNYLAQTFGGKVIKLKNQAEESI